MRGVPLEFCLRPLYNVRGPKLGGFPKESFKVTPFLHAYPDEALLMLFA